jgi:hypothetical protein
LQGLAGFRQRGPRLAQFFRRLATGVRAAQQRLEPVRARRNLAVQRLGGFARARLLVGGLADGVLRALARVDGVAQGLAVVALLDGGARLRQAGRRRRVVLGGEPVGAGGSGGIDGGLRLVDLLLGRLGAARHRKQQECDEQRDPRDPRPKQRDPRGPRPKQGDSRDPQQKPRSPRNPRQKHCGPRPKASHGGKV